MIIFRVIFQFWRSISGGAAVSLEVPPPEPKGFLERNRKGITMMFGVIIASSVVKFMRCISQQNQTIFCAFDFRQYYRRPAMHHV